MAVCVGKGSIEGYFVARQAPQQPCGSEIDPRLSISKDFFCSFSFSERKGGDKKENQPQRHEFTKEKV
jgi:hypothetical protein